MEDALKEAISMTDFEDTLIIVTADHSHVFDIAGYAYRGTDIFGKFGSKQLYTDLLSPI